MLDIALVEHAASNELILIRAKVHDDCTLVSTAIRTGHATVDQASPLQMHTCKLVTPKAPRSFYTQPVVLPKRGKSARD